MCTEETHWIYELNAKFDFWKFSIDTTDQQTNKQPNKASNFGNKPNIDTHITLSNEPSPIRTQKWFCSSLNGKFESLDGDELSLCILTWCCLLSTPKTILEWYRCTMFICVCAWVVYLYIQILKSRLAHGLTLNWRFAISSNYPFQMAQHECIIMNKRRGMERRSIII